MNDDSPHNKPICKTYIQHQGKWFFVSTIERESSAPIIPSPRYWETIVWDYDYDTGERGNLVWMDDAQIGDIGQHVGIVNNLFRHGKV